MIISRCRRSSEKKKHKNKKKQKRKARRNVSELDIVVWQSSCHLERIRVAVGLLLGQAYKKMLNYVMRVGRQKIICNRLKQQ